MIVAPTCEETRADKGQTGKWKSFDNNYTDECVGKIQYKRRGICIKGAILITDYRQLIQHICGSSKREGSVYNIYVGESIDFMKICCT